MRTIIMFIHIAVSIGLISLVLLQHGRGADAGAAFGSGASQTLFGARGSSNFLTRTTAILATIFFTTSILLAYITGQTHQRQSVTEILPIQKTVSPPPQIPGQEDLPVSSAPQPTTEKITDTAQTSTQNATPPVTDKSLSPAPQNQNQESSPIQETAPVTNPDNPPLVAPPLPTESPPKTDPNATPEIAPQNPVQSNGEEKNSELPSDKTSPP